MVCLPLFSHLSSLSRVPFIHMCSSFTPCCLSPSPCSSLSSLAENHTECSREDQPLRSLPQTQRSLLSLLNFHWTSNHISPAQIPSLWTVLFLILELPWSSSINSSSQTFICHYYWDEDRLISIEDGVSCHHSSLPYTSIISSTP